MPDPIAIYREDGGKFRVYIRADYTDDEGMRSVSLECIETLRPAQTPHGPMSIAPDTEFTVACKRGYESVVGWTLTEES